jgi:hypothetical protein
MYTVLFNHTTKTFFHYVYHEKSPVEYVGTASDHRQ